jgi:hypothetical protein
MRGGSFFVSQAAKVDGTAAVIADSLAFFEAS